MTRAANSPSKLWAGLGCTACSGAAPASKLVRRGWQGKLVAARSYGPSGRDNTPPINVCPYLRIGRRGTGTSHQDFPPRPSTRFGSHLLLPRTRQFTFVVSMVSASWASVLIFPFYASLSWKPGVVVSVPCRRGALSLGYLRIFLISFWRKPGDLDLRGKRLTCHTFWQCSRGDPRIGMQVQHTMMGLAE